MAFCTIGLKFLFEDGLVSFRLMRVDDLSCGPINFLPWFIFMLSYSSDGSNWLDFALATPVKTAFS